jgi:ABC-type Fe3+/spermidine/putrescine transport system ATPase subunit
VLSGRAVGANEIALDGNEHRVTVDMPLTAGEAVQIVLRPEQLKLSREPRPNERNVLPGTVRRLTFHGRNVECDVGLGGNLSLRVAVATDMELEKDMPVWISIGTLDGSVFRGSSLPAASP